MPSTLFMRPMGAIDEPVYYAGGNPFFDEFTGTYRSDTYQIDTSAPPSGPITPPSNYKDYLVYAGGNPFFDESTGKTNAPNVFVEFQERAKGAAMSTSIRGMPAISISPTMIQDQRMEALIHAIGGVPVIRGGQYSSESQERLNGAQLQALVEMQEYANLGMTYEEALSQVWTDHGSPPLTPRTIPVSQLPPESHGAEGVYVPKCPPVCYPKDGDYCPCPP